VRYLGFDDRWLELCLDSLRPGEQFRVRRFMREQESEQFQIIRELLPDLSGLVGARCFELLAAGYALSSEGRPIRENPTLDAKLRAHLNRVSGRQTGVDARWHLTLPLLLSDPRVEPGPPESLPPPFPP
jgi:hypothetical protein